MRRALPPILIVLVSLAAAWAMILSHEPPNAGAQVDLRTWAEVVRAVPESVRLSVQAQGTAEPRMEAELVAEVGGRLVEVSPHLEAGGSFSAGDVLARIDDRDYRNALARARAVRDRARSEVDVRTKGRARIEELAREGLASDSTLDDAINSERIARASAAEAAAALSKAELDLERVTIRAPFAGRVRKRLVGAGQFVMPGARLAAIYATDVAEIRLPLSVDDLAFLDLPLAYSSASSETIAPEVRITSDVAGKIVEWSGKIVRTEGALDPMTRNVLAVAAVDDPFGAGVPLAPGLFVDAEIVGRLVDDVFVLPASAYRPGVGLFVVDDDERLQIRAVRVLRRDGTRVFVSEGIEAGERVVVSALESPIAGMRMRVSEIETKARKGFARGARGADS